MSDSLWVAVAAVALLGLVAALVEGRARTRQGREARGRQGGGAGPAGPGTPRRGEIWWADVPFADGPGSKDRPCLVVSVRGRHARVAKITSQSHERRPGVVPLPPGTVDDPARRRSYLETAEMRRVPLSAFRRRAGSIDAATMKSLKLS
ncbi:type II toxin-antitoxin system PemK/MazF family toxin [Streptomyces sp. NBC_01477]|uniref:type II toxin-antitoxin system PemK/MazF family toxin n=1 Tax=Streptomyces sp. NBC_01477 TaxID=2976015 RepID=UPI002E2F3AD1|nr:type II toxin-antitoxin system PemK/MazF family toxin [Streptomyces sp. NBC_01477]